MKLFLLSKNKSFVEKLLNRTVNIFVLMLTFEFLTRKSVSFTLDNMEIFDTVTPYCCTNYSALQNTENSTLIIASYTRIILSKHVVLHIHDQGKNSHNSSFLHRKDCVALLRLEQCTIHHTVPKTHHEVLPSVCCCITTPQEQDKVLFKTITI